MDNNIIAKLGKMITVKTVFSIVSIGAVVPLCKVLYWVFETSYFGYFGISPEIFSRPIFSSGFISVWLFAISMYPILFVWTGIIFISFIFLVSLNYEEPMFEKENKEIVKSKDKNIDKPKKNLTTWIKNKTILSNLLDSISKSFAMPFVSWVSGLIVLMVIAGLFIWVDKKGRELAKNQVNSYVTEYKCNDGFNNNNIGCFEISGIKGSDHFVITNSKSHLIYMTRGKITSNPNEKTQKIDINIIEKTSNEVFKIKRLYKRNSSNNAE